MTRAVYCRCSRAQSNRGAASPLCLLHGDSHEADIYRKGFADGASGLTAPEKRKTEHDD